MFKRKEDVVEKELDARILRSLEIMENLNINDTVDTEIQDEVMDLFAQLDYQNEHNEKYVKIVETIDKLMKLRSNKTENYVKMVDATTKLLDMRKKKSINADTWVTVGTHLAGIVMILGYEQSHVIASKAFSLLKKIA